MLVISILTSYKLHHFIPFERDSPQESRNQITNGPCLMFQVANNKPLNVHVLLYKLSLELQPNTNPEQARSKPNSTKMKDPQTKYPVIKLPLIPNFLSLQTLTTHTYPPLLQPQSSRYLFSFTALENRTHIHYCIWLFVIEQIHQTNEFTLYGFKIV